MWEWAGKQAIDGALSRIGELVNSLDAGKVDSLSNEYLWKFKNIPIIGFLFEVSGDVKHGYDAMSGQEKVTFWKNVLIALAKAAA